MVEMSLRGKWADIFWFSLFHELGHVLLHHSKKETFIGLDPGYRREVSEEEKNADVFARNELISPTALDRFVAKGVYAISAIQDFARQIGVHPGVVAGRLEFDKMVPHGTFTMLRHQYEMLPA